MSKGIKWNWQRITLLSLVLVLITARLVLPYFVTRYVNTVLADLHGYTGKINDIDIALIRGAYVLKGLQIDKVGGKVPVPFLKCETLDLAVEWKALLHLKVKAKVRLEELVLNFVEGPTKESSQSGKEVDWASALDKLLPIDVNRFEVNKGKINYRDFNASPQIDIYLNEVELIATNLSNVVDQQKLLPSALYVSSRSSGGGKLLVTGSLNVMKKFPDADLNLKLTEVDLTAFNGFTQAHAGFDFEKGNLALFSQVAMVDGKIDGYVKPLLRGIKVLKWSEEKEPFTNKLWEGAIGLVIDALKNHQEDQFATKLEIHGDVHDKKIDMWLAVLNVLRNGFIKAFDPKFDHSTVAEKKITEQLARERKNKIKDH
jgi:hypothetical protein